MIAPRDSGLATFGLSHHMLHQERQRSNSMLSYKGGKSKSGPAN